MSFFTILSKTGPNRFFGAIVLGLVAGICYSLLIPLVLTGIAPPDDAFPEVEATITTFLTFEVSNPLLASVYLLICLIILFGRSASEIMLAQVGAEAAKMIRISFYRDISNAPISYVELIGSAKLMASINIDVPRIVAGVRILPGVFILFVTLVGMLGFLFYLNVDVFKVVMLSIVIGVVVCQLPLILGYKIFENTREINDSLQSAIEGLILGIKELKIDDCKRNMYFERILLQHEESLVKAEKTGHIITRSTISLGDMQCFFVIGVVSFICSNYFAINRQELVGIVMVLLYITTPIAVILNSIQVIINAIVSYRKTISLLSEMPKEEISADLIQVDSWDSLTFQNVTYHYPSMGDEQGFGIGPIDLTIKRGEITFIVGGNGSGKSTLCKLITQHYLPCEGNILFGGNKVTADLVTSYRQKISTVYSNYHLFTQLFIDNTSEKERIADHYLHAFNLNNKVSLDSGRFSTTSLSDGQRKRLALLVALLDDKELYLFDEWAADQDPEFRDIFYTEILPELKSKGKAIVVVSHDDRYFSVADKVLCMDNGKLKPVSVI